MARFFSTTARLTFGVLAIGLALAGSALGQLPEVRIAIVTDGPWERSDEVREVFEGEIEDLLEGEFEVEFPPPLVADFSAAEVEATVDRVFADPDVDFLIALGAQSSNHVAHRDELPIPVIAPYVVNAHLQGIPMEGGASGKRNLSYISIETDSVEDVKRLLEITPFRRLAVLSSRELYKELPRGTLEEGLRQANIDVEVVTITVGERVDEALAALTEDIEAVYVTPLIELKAGEFQRLVDGLIERKLPSLSLWGREEVEMGILAGLGLDLDVERIARRTALNLQRILLGEAAPGELPVAFEQRRRLTLNMRTARAIGVYPSFAMMTEAEVLQDEHPVIARQVSLPSAVREAVRVNLALLSAERSVAAGRQRVRRARADLRPQATVTGSGSVIDENRASSSFGSSGRFNLTGTAGVYQVIYSEQLRSNYDVEGHLQTSREEERNQLRLDIIRDAAVAYLNVLRGKTVERIQKNNLDLTRSNLELARNRQTIGVAGPDEVLRFETEIATNRRHVIDASALRNQAEIELNRILNRPLEEPFETMDAALDDPELTLSFARLRPYINSRATFRVFRDFMVEEAFSASPEIRWLDAAVAAQQRVLLAARRSFYVPEVAALAELAGVGRYATTGSSLSGLPPEITFPQPSNLQWTVGFNATLPLFTSGARRAEVDRAREELSALNVDRDVTRQQVEQRARAALHSAGASFAGIELANLAAEAADRTLNLVTDSYSRGLVDNIRLLDAQNLALLADLEAANAIYNFLADLMEVERGVGRFDFFVTPSEEQAFFERLESFYDKQGMPIRK